MTRFTRTRADPTWRAGGLAGLSEPSNARGGAPARLAGGEPRRTLGARCITADAHQCVSLFDLAKPLFEAIFEMNSSDSPHRQPLQKRHRR